MSLYLKAIGETVEVYPYTEAMLKADYPNTSFPAELTPDVWTSHGANPVSPTTPPAHDPYTENLVELTPVIEDEEWVQAWSVVPATPEQIEARALAAKEALRQELASYYDATARLGGFSDRLGCAARAGYDGPYQAHGATFGEWMDSCNVIASQLSVPYPPLNDIIETFPPLAWPMDDRPFAP